VTILSSCYNPPFFLFVFGINLPLFFMFYNDFLSKKRGWSVRQYLCVCYSAKNTILRKLSSNVVGPWVMHNLHGAESGRPKKENRVHTVGLPHLYQSAHSSVQSVSN
jgi:hypothetical protein